MAGNASNSQHCIKMGFTFKISLCFIRFDKVESEDQVLATFCGKEDRDPEQTPGREPITSPGSRLSLTFRSDFSNEERFTGFDAHYAAVDIDECLESNDEELACDHHCHNYIGGYYCSCRFGYILHSDNRTCKVECSNNLFTQRSGVIHSPDFPNSYPKSSDCGYRIGLEEGFFITLQFDENFDIEDHPEVTCPYDYIKVSAFNPLEPQLQQRRRSCCITSQTQILQLFFTRFSLQAFNHLTCSSLHSAWLVQGREGAGETW
uniref:CUB domain-containing protein n=1 Tax=Laticauda laticaudata TaxID=8630 RepID=A0A8C5RRE2_LATLA